MYAQPPDCMPSSTLLCMPFITYYRPCLACLRAPFTKIDIQEQQIRQLENHVAQLKDSLQAGGLISQSVASAGGDTTEGLEAGDGGEAEQTGNRGADGDLP